MRDTALLYPVFVQVFLTFFIVFWMAKERIGAVRDGTVVRNEPGQRPTWPKRAAIVSNAYHNQFEMPVLFYAVCAFAMLANGVDSFMLLLAWIYVILRILHAGIHTTYNHVPHRFAMFKLSNIVLLIMWVKLALHVLSSGVAPL